MRWWSVTDGIEWKWKLPRLVINNWRRNAHIHTHARSIFRSFYTNQLLWFINIYLTSGQWQNKWERTQIVNNCILTFSPVFFFFFFLCCSRISKCITFKLVCIGGFISVQTYEHSTQNCYIVNLIVESFHEKHTKKWKCRHA